MSTPPPPPPRRNAPSPAASSSSSAAATGSGWKGKAKVWGSKAMDKAIVASDWAGGHINNGAAKIGSEAFYPVTGDFPEQMNKAARILRAFTVDGIETSVETEVKGIKRQRKVLRKIPPEVLQNACGLAIFTSMRTAFSFIGGAGGAGVVVARLEDGSWSAPTSMSPNSLTAGFMIGVDIFDAVLVIRTPAALKSFASHKATLGSDIGVAAGPFGAGAAIEVGLEKAPVLSYVKSRGLYVGVQMVGQVFVDRFDENAAMYHWPGIKAGDILAGKVKSPPEAAALQAALQAACSGAAQREKHAGSLDVVVYPEVPDSLVLGEGEVLKLPPTPSMTPPSGEGDSDDDKRPIKRAPPDLIAFHDGEMTESERREHEQDFNDRFAAASILPPPALPSRRPAATSDTSPTAAGGVSVTDFQQIEHDLDPHGQTGSIGLVSASATDVASSSHGDDLPPSYDAAAPDVLPLAADHDDGFPVDKKEGGFPPALPSRSRPSTRPTSPTTDAMIAEFAAEDSQARRESEEFGKGQHQPSLKKDDGGEMTSVVI